MENIFVMKVFGKILLVKYNQIGTRSLYIQEGMVLFHHCLKLIYLACGINTFSQILFPRFSDCNDIVFYMDFQEVDVKIGW